MVIKIILYNQSRFRNNYSKARYLEPSKPVFSGPSPTRSRTDHREEPQPCRCRERTPTRGGCRADRPGTLEGGRRRLSLSRTGSPTKSHSPFTPKKSFAVSTKSHSPHTKKVIRRSHQKSFAASRAENGTNDDDFKVTSRPVFP